MDLTPTPSQTAGPYFHLGCTQLHSVQRIAGSQAKGQHLRLICRVLDGDGRPVPDAMVEIWQADAQGRFSDPQDKRALPNSAFRGFGRCGTDPNGDYAFDTIKPGQVPDPDGKPQAPHLLVSVFMRGVLRRLITRIYFPNEPGNAADFILNLVEPARHATLIAIPKTSAGDAATLVWNVVLQGAAETVFFDLGL